jgi:hypothetical protein
MVRTPSPALKARRGEKKRLFVNEKKKKGIMRQDEAVSTSTCQ